MASGSGERPTLQQLRAAARRQARGSSSTTAAGQRRRREEHPSSGEDPASKRPREEESLPPQSPPRAVDAPQPAIAQTTQASVEAPPAQAPGRRVVTAQRGAAEESEVAPPPEPWAPSFADRQGGVLTNADSVRGDPNIANLLLKGLALPVDMSSLDAASLDDNFLELHTNLVKASQASIATHKKAVALARATRAAEAKLKEERKASAQLKKEVESLARQMEDLSLGKHSAEERAAAAEIDARTAEERAKATEEKAKEALQRATAAEGRLRDLQVEQQDLLTVADENGFRRGEQEAEKQYLKESEEMEVRAFKKGYRLGHKDCFPGAYTRGVDACNAPPDAEARTVPEVPEPEVPLMPMDDEDEDVAEGQTEEPPAQ